MTTFDLGKQARKRGDKKDANPYANKPSLREQAQHWLSGWIEADSEIKAAPKGGASWQR